MSLPFLHCPGLAGESHTSRHRRHTFQSTFFPSSTFPSTISPTAAAPRRKCSVQSALLDVSGSIYNGLSANSDIIWLQNAVLQSTSELGLSLFSQEPMSWWRAVVAPVALSFLFAPPGSLAGLADFFYAPIHVRSLRSFSAEDVEIGRQLGEGSFGVVYEGFFGRGSKREKSQGLHVVLKKAKMRVKGASEIHNSEIHMNYRLQRTTSFACAEFLGTMHVKPSHAHGKLSEGVWLVWNFQGDRSLDYYLKQKSFPENLMPIVLGKNMQASSKEEIFRWNGAVIKEVFKQILMNLQDLHRSGVVHRDVKPLNLILDQNCGRFKFIDFGACVDLRSGFNYVPNETVIDPTYAAPEHYVMPTSTPNLPPDPLCSLVSPLFWLLNTPDRFDLYSAGLILMQLSMKSLRHDTGLQAFNLELKRNGYNLKKWRETCRHSKDEFAFLDADGGAGWELVTALLQPRHDKDHFIWPSLGSSRPSASAALKHRFFNGSFAISTIFPKELPDSLSDVLPDFNVVTQSLSNAAMKVIHSSNKYMDKPTLDDSKEKKLRMKTSSPPSMPSVPFISKAVSPGKQSNGVKNVRSKDVENVPGNLWMPNLGIHSVSDSEILPSASVVKDKLGHVLQGVVNGGPLKIHAAEVDALGRSQRASEVDVLVTSEVEKSVEQQESNANLSGIMSSSSASSPIGAALPTVTRSAVALAAGWLVFSGLNSSAQASYEFGKLLMSSSGISGSAFFAFFLVIKPWLEEHGVSIGKNEDTKAQAAGESGTRIELNKFKSNHLEHIKVEVVAQAMQELDTHMSVLEALMLEEQRVSQQQKELVQRLESLLLQSSTNESLSQPVEEDHTFIRCP